MDVKQKGKQDPPEDKLKDELCMGKRVVPASGPQGAVGRARRYVEKSKKKTQLKQDGEGKLYPDEGSVVFLTLEQWGTAGTRLHPATHDLTVSEDSVGLGNIGRPR
jgi:hypothetical protein